MDGVVAGTRARGGRCDVEACAGDLRQRKGAAQSHTASRAQLQERGGRIAVVFDRALIAVLR